MADTWDIPTGDGNSDANENGALGTVTGAIGDVLGVVEEYGDVAGKGARRCHQLSHMSEAARWIAPRNAEAVLS